MEIVYDEPQPDEYVKRALANATDGGRAGPPAVLIDRFLEDAIEIDVDALFDGTEMYLGGIMEHIEEAGIHSGDSACVLPPVTLWHARARAVRAATEAIAAGVGVRGLLNIQFALASDVLYVLEANPRASRTVPFVSKATGVPMAKAAALIGRRDHRRAARATGMLPGRRRRRCSTRLAGRRQGGGAAVQAVPHPGGQRRGLLLGPEMRSTGEVMGIDRHFPTAFAKSQAAANNALPTEGKVFVSVANRDKRAIIMAVKRLSELGFEIVSTEGTADVLRRNGIQATRGPQVVAGRGAEGEPPSPTSSSPARSTWCSTPRPAGERARDGYEIRAAATAVGRP